MIHNGLWWFESTPPAPIHITIVESIDDQGWYPACNRVLKRQTVVIFIEADR